MEGSTKMEMHGGVRTILKGRQEKGGEKEERSEVDGLSSEWVREIMERTSSDVGSMRSKETRRSGGNDR